MNRRDTLTTYFGVFIVVIVIIVAACFSKNIGSAQNFVYQDSPHKSRSRCLQESDREKLILETNYPIQNRVAPRQHPVLEYQRNASYGTVPASFGDPIRPLGIGASPSPSHFRSIGNNSSAAYAYNPGRGPYPGVPMGVPVQQGALKLSNETTGYPFYSSAIKRGGYEGQNPSYPFHYQKKPLGPYDFFKPYGPNQPSMQSEIVYADTPFYNRPEEIYAGINPGVGSIPFIGSVDSFAPFPEVISSWEKSGIIQTVDPDSTEIMNAYRKPISPLRDLFEYSVQDKNGFVVPLKETYLEDGDIIRNVPGREALGKWKYRDFVKNKYIWM